MARAFGLPIICTDLDGGGGLNGKDPNSYIKND